MNKKTVSLVLGSGGARGLAHIGVIHWLEENNYKISTVTGCSMGALVGGIYAAGKLDEFEQWVCAISKVDIITLLDLSWEKSGLVKGDKIINTLIELVGDLLIEDLPIPYTAVATDIRSHREVWINSGRLFDAIRATISIPLLFTPSKFRGVELIDGGVLNPVPIAPTFADDTDITIAVDLNGPELMTVPELTKEHEIETKTENTIILSQWREKIDRYIELLRSSVHFGVDRDWGPYDITIQAFETMQSTISRQKLAAYPPDIVIEIPRNACKTLEFYRASEMIDLGYTKAKERMSREIN